MDVMYDWTVFSSPSLLVSCPIPLSLPAMCSIWTLWNSIVYGLIRREEADLFSFFLFAYCHAVALAFTSSCFPFLHKPITDVS